MSERSRGDGRGRGNLPIQRPLRKYKQEIVDADAEFARKLQEEEERRSKQFISDEILARQIAEQMNVKEAGPFHNNSVPDEHDELLARQLAEEINGHDYETDGACASEEGVTDLQRDFARYRGMTAVDSLLARQIQQQEEESANNMAAARLSAPDEEEVMSPVHPGFRPNVTVGQRVYPGARGPGRMYPRPPRRHLLHARRHHPGGEDVLPAGEEDPVTLLMGMGGGAEADFVNMMQDPVLLVMALSRAPGFTGNQDNIDLNDYEQLWELAERLGEVQKKGLSEAEIGILPERTYQAGATASSQPADCQICLTPFQQGESIRMLPCLHEYHSSCVDEWLKRNSSCPICRQEVTTQ